MQLITFSGPPSSGKTSVILHTVRAFQALGKKAGVIKMDCLVSDDAATYQKWGIPAQTGISGNLCPDHYFVSNIEACVQWGRDRQLDLLITESAGLCNRCSPHLAEIPAVCVIDNLMGVNTPKKIGPMLKMADIAVITKGDVVSQAEREVFAFRVRQANPQCLIMNINGITGQGCGELAGALIRREGIDSLKGRRLRFSMPAALCSYCLGETRIGRDFQMGNTRRMILK